MNTSCWTLPKANSESAALPKVECGYGCGYGSRFMIDVEDRASESVAASRALDFLKKFQK